MSTSELFLIAMAIVFTVPFLIWRLGRTNYYAPLVVVQILAGIILGPGVLGAAFPAYYNFVFTPEVTSALQGIAWWGVMIFVWSAGLELNLKKVWAHRRETSVSAGLALAVPIAFGALAAYAMLQFSDGWVGEKGRPWQFMLAIGMACAVTSLPILVLFMDRLGVLRQPFGQRILRYASLDDVVLWAVLALILLDWTRVGRQAGFLVVFAGATFIVRRLMQKAPEADRWFMALIWLILCAVSADWAGLHFMVGAFLAGAVLDAEWFDQAHRDQFRAHVLLILMPVYFLSTGLRTHWEVGGVAVFAAAGLLVAASVGGKLLGVQIAGKLLKWEPGEAGVIGWMLQTKALVGIVFVNILLDKGIITGNAFTATLLMAVVSTMLTMPMVTPRLAKLIDPGDDGA